MTDTEIPSYSSLACFLIDTPLYAKYRISETNDLNFLYGRDNLKFDGHCRECHKNTTYALTGQHVPGGDPWRDIMKRDRLDCVKLICARDTSHIVHIYFHINVMTIKKIGQLPSLADIAVDEAKKYRAVLDKKDGADFNRAIGLAAHGVGAGSFVYLRRIFERLIVGRFEKFKISEGWVNEQFYGVRMEDKISLLREHLPEFLYENRRIYSILSIGVHEMEEEKCLSYFDLMRQSILIILDDDNEKLKQLKIREVFSKAIAQVDINSAT